MLACACVFASLCVSTPEAIITSGVMWCDIRRPHMIGQASSMAFIWQL